MTHTNTSGGDRMMLYKACPKCRGDLGLEYDIYGGPPDLVCVQCGYTARPQERLTLLARVLDQHGQKLTPAPAWAPTERRRAS